ncbi:MULTISPECIES: hypothetical protein [Ramlibacter]|uniref:Uncharacterized protein n=1 Tax=Ramlibacter pinisoli TaxID=2682844 RepID=A0A6N8J1G7_9BURK|nr:MULTISPECIES: hypothetical protein [Ramlibacter]MBA2962178.1 hypothetical protein [Ramlibacter sp. CGMCC 1.13660]MVQ32120.1 hypothetical protein [Ramlibacter pinisoli]
MTAPANSGAIALRAIGLMAEWRRLGAAHLALGGGVSCACGSAFDGISVEDLEHDLVDYVHEKHRGTPALGLLFAAAGCTSDASCDLATLLRTIAEARIDDPALLEALLADLERAISGLANDRR